MRNPRCQFERITPGRIRCVVCQSESVWTRPDILPKANCQVDLAGGTQREWNVCVHRGEQLRLEGCKLCGDRERQEPVYACTKHSECSHRKYRDDGRGPMACMSCPDYSAAEALTPGPSPEMGEGRNRRVLLVFGHGLGDAVQFSVVLRHLRRERPNLEIHLASYPDRRDMYGALIDGFVPLQCDGTLPMVQPRMARMGTDEEEGTKTSVVSVPSVVPVLVPVGEAFDQVYHVPWPEPQRVFADSPGTKAERMLREPPFNITADPDLCRYRIRISGRAREVAARFAGELQAPFALLHNSGVTGGLREVAAGRPDVKNLPPAVFAAAVERVQAHGLVPVVLAWDDYSGTAARPSRPPELPGCLYLRADHWLWQGDAIADPATIAALAAKARLCVGVDSGPGHVFGAEDANYWRPGTPTVIGWVGNHPLNYYGLSPNVLHVLQTDRLTQLRGDWDTGRDFFRARYNHQATQTLMAGVPMAIDRLLSPPRYALRPAADATLQHWILDLCRPDRRYDEHPGQPHDRPTSLDLAFRLVGERFCNVRPVIVETGCIREADDWSGAGNFGVIAARYVAETGGTLHSIDLFADKCSFARERLRPFGACVQVHQSDSVAWLAASREPIDFLYLDSLDTYDDGHAEHCLAEIQAAAPRLHKRSIVVIDDTPLDKQGVRFGKGVLALPWLEQHGWRMLHAGYQIVAVRAGS